MTSARTDAPAVPIAWRYGTLALGGATVVLAVAAAVVGLAATHPPLAAITFVLAPLTTCTAVLAARSVARPEARSAWMVLAAACVSAAAGQLISVVEVAPTLPSAPDVLSIVFHLCVAEAAILALRPARDARFAIEIALDGLLVLLSAAVLVLRFQLDAALAAGWLSVTEGSVLLVGQIAVVGSLLFSALLVMWRDSELGAMSIDALFVAALLFSFGDALGGAGLDVSPSRGLWTFDLVRLTGWVALTGSAVVAWRWPGPTLATSRRSAVARRMRLMVIPAAVLFLCAWALGGQGSVPATSLRHAATAALGLVLAVRVGVAIYAGEHEADERQAAEARAGRARIRAITAQMNPHFLFNTLHSLSALVRRDASVAEDVLERLGGLLRYGIDQGDTPLPLEDEWRFTESYLHLEQVRLGPRLTVTTSLDPDALERIVPPFVLQPLVENAIRHAIDCEPEGGSLAVRADLLPDDTLRIEVEDSGRGADEQAIFSGTGVGLRGVRAQLAAHFGDQARMEAQRTASGRFVVRLLMPPLDE